MEAHHHVHFNLQSEHYPHAFQSITLEVDEVMNVTERFQTYISALANKLNSGKSFKPSSALQADLNVIKTPKKKKANQIHMRKKSHFGCITRQTICTHDP